MTGLAETLVAQARDYSPLEASAVVLAILYLLLAIRQNIWCWLCAGISTAIFAYLFFAARLYMESALNVFYFGMAIYGWQSWYYGRVDDHDMPVVVWRGRTHAVAVAAIVAASLLSGFLLESQSDAAYPYIDSATSWAAVWATFLLARKVLENWWYWLVIDATMIWVFWAKDLELTAVLYGVYLVLIPFGLAAWMRSRQDAAR